MPETASTPARPTAAQGPATGAPQPAPSAFTAEGDVHILDRLAVLYRYRRIATAVFILTTIAMMIQGYTTLKMFRSQARLLIEDERSTAVPGMASDNYYEDPDLYYKTQYRILKGRDLTRRVVRRLNLASVPEFNGTAEPPPTPATIVRDLQQRIIGLLRPANRLQAEPPKVDESPDESSLVNAFISRVNVDPVPGSKLVDVTFDSTDPKLAMLATNTLVDEYVEQNLEVKLQIDAEHDRLARQGARQAAAEGRGERARARRLPRIDRTPCPSTTSRTSCSSG